MSLLSFFSRPRLRRRLLLVGLVALIGWLAFFDSHSLVRRVGYYHELRQISAENERLKAENIELAEQVNEGLSDEMTERVAREQYGMRRPGETVYRLEEDH